MPVEHGTLAYSSVSQMGLLAIGLGAGLMAPEVWTTTLVLCLLYVTHHAFAKGALFLGVGVCASEIGSKGIRIAVIAGMLIAAFSLAGLKFTSGLTTKVALKYTVAVMPEPWAIVMKWLLPFTGLATALLVSRFLWLAWLDHKHSHGRLHSGMLISWGAVTVAVILIPFCLRVSTAIKPAWLAVSPATIWAAAWPIGIALAIVVVTVGPCRRSRLWHILRIPPGDLVVPLSLFSLAITSQVHWWATDRLPKLRDRFTRRLTIPFKRPAPTVLQKLAATIERELIAGISIAVIAVAILFLSWYSTS